MNEREWPALKSLDQHKARCKDIDDDLFWSLYDRWRAQTLIPPERLYMSYCALRNVIENRVPGDVVECGVFRGGSLCFFVQATQALGDPDRRFWAYDTFDGFPVDVDEVIHDGTRFQRENWHTENFESIFRTNVAALALPDERLEVIKGSVLDTLPARAPVQIAFLHLDTDYYEATRHELHHLYHRVPVGGAVMVDDYGHFRGSRRATDEFCAGLARKPLLLRADYAGRLLVPR